MHEPARNRTDTWKRLQRIAGDRERDGQNLTHPTLAEIQKTRNLQLARILAIQSTESARKVRTEISLDDDIGARCYRRKCANDRLARRVCDDLVRTAMLIFSFRVGELFLSKIEQRMMA